MVILKCLFYLVLRLLGSRRVSQLYFKHVGEGFHEPRPDELARLIFAPRRKLSDLITTLVECILKPSLQAMIHRSNLPAIHIIQGDVDLLYIPYVQALYRRYSNILLHKMTGDHHAIYHHPNQVAEKLNCLPTHKSAITKIQLHSSFKLV